MRLLDRYLLRELLVPLGYCLGGFLLFYCSFDLIGHLREFQNKRLLFFDCVEYYVVTAPELIVTILPIALLLALLYALTNLSRNNEMTAMRAAGIGLWRLALPYLAIGVLFSAAVFILNEYWVPQSQDKAERILQRRLAPDAQIKKLWCRDLNFSYEGQNRSWRVKLFNLVNGEMISPSIIWELRDGSRREIYAQRACYSNEVWHFFNVEEWRKVPQEPFPVQSTNAQLQLELPETPELMRSEIKINSLSLAQAAKRPQLSIAETRNYLQLHPRIKPGQKAMLQTQLQGRIAEPLKCLIVVLMALPFGVRSGRRNVFVGVASSIFICFSFFILQRLCLTLGTGAYLSPQAAAWLPNLVFGLAGIIMTTRVR